MSRIVVIGASTNPQRFSVLAVRALLRDGYEVVPIGKRSGKIAGLDILTNPIPLEEVDKVVLYINPEIQKQYYSYILELNPREIIFNPGTENQEFARLAQEHEIDVRYDCTLVLLDAGMF